MKLNVKSLASKTVEAASAKATLVHDAMTVRANLTPEQKAQAKALKDAQRVLQSDILHQWAEGIRANKAREEAEKESQTFVNTYVQKVEEWASCAAS